MKSASCNHVFYSRCQMAALATGCVLFVLTALWVPVAFSLMKAEYYKINLFHGMKARAFLGSIAQILLLSPGAYLGMLQAFKFGWILLICTQFFRWIHDRYIAFLLCVMFAFNSTVYINDHISGFIDMATHFWLLLAATLVVNPKGAEIPSRFRFGMASILAIMAILTHEIAILFAVGLMLWSLLRYGKQALVMVVPWTLFVLYYLWFIWNQPRSADISPGYSPAEYYRILKDINYFLHEALSIIGILTSAGMLWGGYVILGWEGVREQKDTVTRYGYSAFVIIALLANLLTQLIASDAQRMVSGILLSLYILIIDQSGYINRHLKSTQSYIICSVICVIHVLIPPMFITGQRANPLNCYAEKLLPAFSYKDSRDMWKLQYNPPEHFDGTMNGLKHCVGY